MDRSAFTYAASRIRALEESLFNQGDLERMLEAKEAATAYRVLNDTDYASHVGDIEKISEFQGVLERSLCDTVELLKKISPDPTVVQLLTLPYDFHNLKTLLKGEKGGRSREERIAQTVPLGSITLEHWEAYLAHRQIALLGIEETLAQAIDEAVKMAEKNYEMNGEDPRQIDLTLDEHLFKILQALSEKTGNEFLINFVRLQIDLYNLSLLVRVVLIGQKAPTALEGGHLGAKDIQKELEENPESILETFGKGTYGDLVTKGIEGFRKDQTFAEFEKGKLETLATFVRQAKGITFGPEPLLAYFINRQNSARVIRMVLVGKMNQIKEDVLRKNIPHVTA